MLLQKALEFLIEDWQKKLRDGETSVPVDEAMQASGGQNWQWWNPDMSPQRVANLVQQDLDETKMFKEAQNLVRPIKDKGELLSKMTFLGLMQDVGV